MHQKEHYIGVNEKRSVDGVQEKRRNLTRNSRHTHTGTDGVRGGDKTHFTHVINRLTMWSSSSRKSDSATAASGGLSEPSLSSE